MMNKFNAFARDYWPLYRTWQLNTPVIHLLLPEHVEVSELKPLMRATRARGSLPLILPSAHTTHVAGLFILDQIYKTNLPLYDRAKNSQLKVFLYRKCWRAAKTLGKVGITALSRAGWAQVSSPAMVGIQNKQ